MTKRRNGVALLTVYKDLLKARWGGASEKPDPEDV